MFELLSHGAADLLMMAGMLTSHAFHLGHQAIQVIDIAADVWGGVADDAREILFISVSSRA